MRATRLAALTLTVLVGLSVGCKNNTVDKSGFKSALNTYYKGQQDALGVPAEIPAQADTSNDEQTKGYDALVDAGLLTRASAEKKRFLVGSKQVNNYDIPPRDGRLGRRTKRSPVMGTSASVIRRWSLWTATYLPIPMHRSIRSTTVTALPACLTGPTPPR